MVKKLRFRKWLALSVPLCFATYVGAQSTPAQNPSSNNNDNGRGDVASFDGFLDSHREIAEQLRKQPSLADNKQFLKDHPALQSYLQQNPSVRDRLEQNPNAFMGQEAHWEHSGDDRTQDRNSGYDRDRNNNNNNNAYDRDRGNANGNNSGGASGNRSANANSTSNNDNGRGDVASFDGFLDSHREIAEQLRKQPSLADNKQFLKDHPALQSYLQQNPSVRERLEQNPNAFMGQEAHWEHSGDDRTQDRNAGYDRDRNNNNNNAYNRDRGNGVAEHDRDTMDRDRDAHQHFGAFLGSHQDIAAQLSRNPSLCNDHDYLQNHPELQTYLNAHPEVRQPLTSDPDTFMKSTQQFNSNGQSGQTGKMPASTATQPKPYKQ